MTKMRWGDILVSGIFVTSKSRRRVQVLQTLSILIQNIRSETAIFYLFSNNYINELITTKLVRCVDTDSMQGRHGTPAASHTPVPRFLVKDIIVNAPAGLRR